MNCGTSTPTNTTIAILTHVGKFVKILIEKRRITAVTPISIITSFSCDTIP